MQDNSLDELKKAEDGKEGRRVVELRCLLQKVKLQRVLGIAANAQTKGSVQDYLEELVTPLEEDPPNPQSQQDCECPSLKSENDELTRTVGKLNAEVKRYKLEVALGGVREDELVKMRKFYYGDDYDMSEVEKSENQRLREENSRLTKKLLETENNYYAKVNEIEDLKQENYTLHEENREIARKLEIMAVVPQAAGRWNVGGHHGGGGGGHHGGRGHHGGGARPPNGRSLLGPIPLLG